jgi:hypothetical protein
MVGRLMDTTWTRLLLAVARRRSTQRLVGHVLAGVVVGAYGERLGVWQRCLEWLFGELVGR